MATTFFKGSSRIGEHSFTEIIEDNIVSYVEWGFLELGAFFNITIPSSGSYGGSRHRLRCVKDPRYEDGQVWEAYRKNWVWQSGLSNVSEQPISISGVFINQNFMPRSSGTFFINYRNGQVIFNNKIATNSTVQLEYSHKWVDVVNSNSVPWFRKGQTRSFRVDDPLFIANSGVWNELADTRLQLPVVAVESVSKTYQGYQLGGSQYARTEFILHIIGEDSSSVKKISSILSSQNESTIYLFDVDRIADENRFSLDYRGEIASGALCYPDLIAPTGDGGYRFTRNAQRGTLRLYDCEEESVDTLNNNLYHGKVRWSTEVILNNI